MKKSKWMPRVVAVFAVLSMVFLAACGGGSDAGGELADKQVLTIGNVASEPPGVDPMKAQDSQSGLLVNQLMVGLVNVDKEGKAHPALATKWESNKEQTEFTFHLRDAKWSNGDPVTAHDFEYAWKRMLDPKNAAVYAYQLFYLKNGEKYNAGKAKAEDVGVKAVDDKTLKVTLERPTPYFVNLTNFYALLPVPKKVVEKNKDWATEAKTFVCNGPFKLKSWEHDSKMVLEKNPNYYDAKKVKLDQINVPFVKDQKTGWQMFKAGELDFGDKNIIPLDLVSSLLKTKEVTAPKQIASYGVEFNTKKKPFNNKKIRQAFSLAIDRDSLVKNVTQSGQAPANGWVPWGMYNPVTKNEWVKEHGKYIDPKPQVNKAKKLLQEGLKEEGLKKMPEVTYIYNTDDGHKKIAEALQQMWKKNLGVDVKVNNMEWKVFLEKKHSGDFDFSRTGWLPDYNDPMTFLDMYQTGSGQNDPKFSNKKYDELLNKAKNTGDQKVRFDAMHKAEDILMDELPVAPLYWYTDLSAQADNVKGVVQLPDDNTYFEHAYVTEE
jgi:oligopeptide transport system substrate-binding protein